MNLVFRPFLLELVPQCSAFVGVFLIRSARHFFLRAICGVSRPDDALARLTSSLFFPRGDHGLFPGRKEIACAGALRPKFHAAVGFISIFLKYTQREFPNVLLLAVYGILPPHSGCPPLFLSYKKHWTMLCCDAPTPSSPSSSSAVMR